MGSLGGEGLTSSGYRSWIESLGICSVTAKVCIPLEMAVWMMASRLSFAWPGQNCPEWLCIENAILIFDFFKALDDSLGNKDSKRTRRRYVGAGA